MLRWRFIFLLGWPGLLASAQAPSDSSFLPRLLKGRSAILDRVLAQPEKYEVQILYTQIDRDRRNRPTFRSYRYRVDQHAYFYPASTVKMPATLLALEKLNRLRVPGLDKYTTVQIDSACCGQTKVRSDSSAKNFLPSVAHYIRKIFVVSDNDAFNRLYEFIGQEALNEELHRKGYRETRIVSRLAVGADREQNRFTNPVRFLAGNQVIYQQPLVENKREYRSGFPVFKGQGEMRGDSLVKQPKDFTHANNFPLEDQQRMLRTVLFPNSVPPHQRHQLTEPDYRFLYQCLSQLPRETRYPAYNAPEYADGYGKFLLYGDRQDTVPDHLRIFNKVGQAYGTLTDNAYVVDFDRGVEFLLSATIYVNEDQILNDDRYEYDTVGLPFLGSLGRVIYEYEVRRQKKYPPDLARFRVTYDISRTGGGQ
ncbi:MAG: serine hydrolase [Ferruginibacter sp.]|nr:serine hydrolase [Cytophagales bacterium]